MLVNDPEKIIPISSGSYTYYEYQIYGKKPFQNLTFEFWILFIYLFQIVFVQKYFCSKIFLCNFSMSKIFFTSKNKVFCTNTQTVASHFNGVSFVLSASFVLRLALFNLLGIWFLSISFLCLLRTPKILLYLFPYSSIIVDLHKKDCA